MVRLWYDREQKVVYILFFFILSQISWFMIQVAASCAFLVMWSMNFPSGSSLMWWSRKLRNFLKQSIINHSQNQCKNKETNKDRGWYGYCRVQGNLVIGSCPPVKAEEDNAKLEYKTFKNIQIYQYIQRFFRHFVWKPGLSFGLSLLHHGILAFFCPNSQRFFRFFVKCQS